MPEGPEIKRVADALTKQIAGRTIDRLYFGLEPLKKWEARLNGRVIKQVESHGKALLIALDNGLSIYSHCQLYGRWHFCNSQAYPDSKRQLRMAIDCQERSALLYSASDIAVLDHEQRLQHPFLSKLGPDVLHESTTHEQLVERLASDRYRNRQLGSVLTDQSFAAGLGNYLRCEILFVSGLHPRSRSRELDTRKLHELACTILTLARQSYQTGGITNDSDRAQQLMAQGATFEEARFYVFRRQGLICYHCCDLIERFSQAGQSCYHCPTCQAG